MKIKSDYQSKRVKGDKLNNGDIVYMKGSKGCMDFYGIYVYGIGIIELENGSDAYGKVKEQLYIGDIISYWTIEKVFKNCELIIRE